MSSDDKCRVMDSKMRPLWLVFHNQDILGESIFHIFKNGDGMIIMIAHSQFKQRYQCFMYVLVLFNYVQTCGRIC